MYDNKTFPELYWLGDSHAAELLGGQCDGEQDEAHSVVEDQCYSKLRSTLLQISIFIIFWSIYIQLWYVLSPYEDAVLQLHLQEKEGGHTGYLQHQGPEESCLPTILRLDTVGAARELCWVVNRLVNLAYKMAPYLNEGLWFGDVRIYWCRAVFRMALYSMNYSTEAKMMVLEISWWAACKLLCQTFILQLSSG